METLLKELLTEIFLFLRENGKDLIVCCRVCKKWNILLTRNENDVVLWKRATINKYDMGDLLLGCSSWKSAFITAQPSRYTMRHDSMMAMYASKCNLRVLPSCILSYSTALIELSVHSNKLSYLPPQLSILTSLTYLDISFNRFRSLPPHLSTLTALQQLYLEHNELPSLPLEYSSFIKLKLLSLYSNPFYTIPSSVFVLTQLTYLNVANTHLSSIPQQLCSSLTNLVHLHLNHNELSTIPSEISLLVNLVELFLNSNELLTVPSQFSSLTKLKYLHLQCNRLTSVPIQFSALTRLDNMTIDTTVSYPLHFFSKLDELHQPPTTDHVAVFRKYTFFSYTE